MAHYCDSAPGDPLHAYYHDHEYGFPVTDACVLFERLALARRITVLQAEHGSFCAWLSAEHPRNKEDWVKLFKKTFKFMGPEVVGEFLMSTGYLPGAHRPDCPVYARIAALSPPWMTAAAGA